MWSSTRPLCGRAGRCALLWDLVAIVLLTLFTGAEGFGHKCRRVVQFSILQLYPIRALLYWSQLLSKEAQRGAAIEILNRVDGEAADREAAWLRSAGS